MQGHFIHTCDVLRPVLADDAHRNKKRTYPLYLAGVRCRLKTEAKRGFNSITAEWVITTSYKLFTQFNAPIQAGDRVTNIRLEDGELVEDVFEVVSDIKRRGVGNRHRTMILEKVK